LTEQELDDKFLHNAGWRISAERSASLLKMLRGTLDMADTAPLFAQLGG
jgi:hypothetical protein